ncbi:hypothetical protein CCY99_03470 [Helicobacter sp. 16-1353]|uniref:hypothetical protein n=1 Tax=Helicobacter sp. 16-1353 TaxID=2004996 RepID=UPI000DCEA146|nr:hypothetical protein [Helicobacter sp. 16-1353]RAX54424.1 hypothetical protein CCY99_03470 [Helicobacter sp. 16-1353]
MWGGEAQKGEAKGYERLECGEVETPKGGQSRIEGCVARNVRGDGSEKCRVCGGGKADKGNKSESVRRVAKKMWHGGQGDKARRRGKGKRGVKVEM